MKLNKLVKKKRGEKGKGRATIFKPINLPEDVIDDLKLYRDIYGIKFSPNKDEYGNPIPVRISYEQVIRRWMDNIGRFDPEVKKEFEARNTARTKYEEKQRIITRCINLVKEANPDKPTASWWMKDEWYVNPDTGRIYPVLKGKDGKSDYARTNGEIQDGQNFCSEEQLLSEEYGYFRVKILLN